MSRPKETFVADISRITYTSEVIKVWGTIADKDRDVMIPLSVDEARSLIERITKAFDGIELEKAKLAEAKYEEYLKLKAMFESMPVPPVVVSTDSK